MRGIVGILIVLLLNLIAKWSSARINKISKMLCWNRMWMTPIHMHACKVYIVNRHTRKSINLFVCSRARNEMNGLDSEKLEETSTFFNNFKWNEMNDIKLNTMYSLNDSRIHCADSYLLLFLKCLVMLHIYTIACSLTSIVGVTVRTRIYGIREIDSNAHIYFYNVHTCDVTSLCWTHSISKVRRCNICRSIVILLFWMRCTN